MTTIINDQSGTLKDLTVEGQLWKLIQLHTKWQKSAITNPENINNVSWSIASNGMSMSANVNLEVEQSVTAQGQPTFTVIEYLTGTGFYNSGTVIKSNVPSAYLMELMFYLQQIENNSVKNPTGLNQVSAGFPPDTKLFTGTVTLTLEDGIDDTLPPSFSAKSYLL